MGPCGSQLTGGTQARATARTVKLALGRWGAARKWRCQQWCLQEGQLPQHLGSSQKVSSCPYSAQPLHSLPTCAPDLAFPREAQHSGDSLGILKMPQWRPELPGSWRDLGSERGEGSPQSCPRELENSRTYMYTQE